MKFIADFHIHSHYSISTSKKLIPEYLDLWARLKGIQVVGSGDFTHPGWLNELKAKTQASEAGLFKLKDELTLDSGAEMTAASGNGVRFLLTAEISNIYKKDGKVRKVHNLIFVPDFRAAEIIQQKLAKIGNITSDGRPILGLDSRDLLEIVLDASDEALFVPAHIWTPWFSVLGAKSGFETIEECYGGMAEEIYAVETGLSSDPPMNWMCSFLDNFTLISNSDAHSPEKLGREANLFNTSFSYSAITEAIKSGRPEHFLGTIEFFPQEGKYHYDGHRKCGIHWDPLETLKHNSVCPVCGKKVTIGVMNRIAELADRDRFAERENRLIFHSLIPLKEILAEIIGVGAQSKKIAHSYNSLIKKAGSEFNLLINLSVSEIAKTGNEVLAEAIKRMRNREVFIEEGFDGEYGRIMVFQESEKKFLGPQELLFKDLIQEKQVQKHGRELINFDLEEYRRLRDASAHKKAAEEKIERFPIFTPKPGFLEELNPEQKRAAEHFAGPALIVAGPGTGKTRTLTCRIANLILNRKVNPENILAVTFTNKAANEIKERLAALLGSKAVSSEIHISTFHAFGFSILKSHRAHSGRDEHFSIIDEEDKNSLLSEILRCQKKKAKQISAAITKAKQNLKYTDKTDKIADLEARESFSRYTKVLKEQNTVDLDDLIYLPVKLFIENPALLAGYQKRIVWILIDEYQDINFVQYRLIKLLMPDKTPNLYVIGDPNQAIYGFRGADAKYISRFLDDYPEAELFRLKRSYRCSNLILQASTQVMQGSEKQSLIEGLTKGVKVKIVENSTDRSEAEFVARTIENMMGGLRFFSIDSQISEGNRASEIDSLADFAVLCRISRQFDVLEKAFNDHSIPYQKIADYPFFKQEPIRTIVDIMKFSINQKNRLLRNKLIEQKIMTPLQLERLSSLFTAGRSLKDIMAEIIDSYFTEERSINENPFIQLLDLADNFGNNLDEFLKFSVLGTGVDTYEPKTENVALMTLHAAKGLEFKCVFVIGCEDGLFPYSIFETEKSNLDEEKRLFYVGMTRAKKFLFLSKARKRKLFGRYFQLPKSPYLLSIEKEITELSKVEYKSRGKEDRQLGLF